MHPKSVLVIITFGDQEVEDRPILIPIGTGDVDDRKTVEPITNLARLIHLGIDGLNTKYGAKGFERGPIKAVVFTAECPGHAAVVPSLNIRACLSEIETEFRARAA